MSHAKRVGKCTGNTWETPSRPSAPVGPSPRAHACCARGLGSLLARPRNGPDHASRARPRHRPVPCPRSRSPARPPHLLDRPRCSLSPVAVLGPAHAGPHASLGQVQQVGQSGHNFFFSWGITLYPQDLKSIFSAYELYTQFMLDAIRKTCFKKLTDLEPS